MMTLTFQRIVWQTPHWRAHWACGRTPLRCLPAQAIALRLSAIWSMGTCPRFIEALPWSWHYHCWEDPLHCQLWWVHAYLIGSKWSCRGPTGWSSAILRGCLQAPCPSRWFGLVQPSSLLYYFLRGPGSIRLHVHLFLLGFSVLPEAVDLLSFIGFVRLTCYSGTFSSWKCR